MTGIGLSEQTKKPKPPLLRPRQVEKIKDEVRRIDDMLKQPQHVLVNVDVPSALRQRKNLNQQLAEQSPKPPSPEERDALQAEEAALREQIIPGMCTQAEMRRNPAGAVDKHRSWERRNKKRISRWKDVRLRMHVGGMLGDLPSDASDIANIEIFRPAGSSHELNMDHCQIPGKDFHLPPGNIVSVNHAEDEDRQRWDDETNAILAEHAARGGTRSRAVLVGRYGEEKAKAMIAEATKNIGTPPERDAKRK